MQRDADTEEQKMDELTYRSELMSILRQQSAAAIQTLRSFDAVLPEKARAVQIMVHPSQDPDGMFTVLIHLDGPELHALNKAIRGCRTLFEVRYVDGRLQPDVPLFDPFSLPFEVNDVIVDTATMWVEELWPAFGGTSRGLPAYACGEERHGTRGMVQLTP